MASPSPETRHRKQRRTWPQRLTIVAVCVAAFACFTAAGALAGGQWVLSQRKLAPLAQTTSQRSGASQLDVVVPDPSIAAAPERRPGWFGPSSQTRGPHAGQLLLSEG